MSHLGSNQRLRLDIIGLSRHENLVVCRDENLTLCRDEALRLCGDEARGLRRDDTFGLSNLLQVGLLSRGHRELGLLDGSSRDRLLSLGLLD